MPSSRSSSSINTRVFAPTTILTQDTRRLAFTIKSSGDGYTMESGITAGDVIRYNPKNNSYVKSKADTETNAEVVGVVESVAGINFTIVSSGSIAYPTSKLNTILDENGLTADRDVLFLDPATSGGLTGTIDIPTDTTSVIVKPVIQLAPHSVYNGMVMNYIGYKVGNATAVESAGAPVGSLVYATPTSTSVGEYYKRIDSGLVLDVADYSELYSIYGTAYGTSTVVIVVDSAVGVSSSLIGNPMTQYSNGSLTTIGTVAAINSVTKQITLTRTGTSSSISVGATVYCKGFSWTLSSQTVKTFTIPPVDNVVQQGDLTLVPFINTKPLVGVSIPDTISIEGLVVTGTAEIGGIADLEQAITQIQSDITTIKNTLRIGGS